MNNKTSDKNVDRIEKDIERCKQLTKPEHASWIGISNQLAITDILAELERRNKRIKELEEEVKTIKTYKLFIRKYNFMKNDYEVVEKIIRTNDIYHEIGYIYCTTLKEIKRIDYVELKEGEK